MTIASKLAIGASQRSVSHETKELRRLLNMPHLLHQLDTRVSALITPYVDENGERDTWYHYGQRVKRVQQWFESQQYAQQTIEMPLSGANANMELAGQSAVDLQDSLSQSGLFDHGLHPSNAMTIAADQQEAEGHFGHYLYDDSFSGIMGGWATYPTTALECDESFAS